MRSLLALVTLLVANAAQGADIEVRTEECGARPATVAIRGKFAQGDDHLFRASTAGIAHAVVFFESIGGNALAGINIGYNIRRRQFQTAVADYESCASACSLAWLGGTSRYLGRNARIGFHSTKNKDGTRSDVGNKVVRRYLKVLRYTSATADYVTRTDPQSLTWLTEKDAKEYGIEFKTLPVPALMLAPADARKVLAADGHCQAAF